MDLPTSGGWGVRIGGRSAIKYYLGIMTISFSIVFQLVFQLLLDFEWKQTKAALGELNDKITLKKIR